MTPLSAGAKPSVLRCGRCGRFVDWEDAKVQIVCACRPRLQLPPVLVRDAAPPDRDAALDLFVRDFGHTEVMAFGERVDFSGVRDLLIAEMKGELAGALAYRTTADALQILALATDPMWQRTGVGGHLLAEAELIARRLGTPRLIVATTNDNLPALYFYQRHGFRITEIAAGAMTAHVRDSHGVGFGGIPIRDEIRLEKRSA
jgi:ribosomal protein S18 acetylase RimI-like enzyme